VVSFRPKKSERKKPLYRRNYLAQREQRRLLLLVLMLGAVVVAVSEARRPERWQWLWGLDGQGREFGLKVDEPPETRLVEKNRLEEDFPDTFTSRPPGRDVKKVKRYFPGVVPEYLNEVEDDTVFRGVERDAWFHLFEILKRADEATLTKGATCRVSFLQLFGQSNEYRGDLVTVGGIARRVHLLAAPKNDYGVGEYYQVWVTPYDNPSSVMVVYVLLLPKGFPTGFDLAENVEIVGFYFKRWVYNAQDGIRTAPVLLARTLQWDQKLPFPIEAPISLTSFVFVVLVSILLTAVFMVVFVRGKRKSQVKPEGDFVDFRTGRGHDL